MDSTEDDVLTIVEKVKNMKIKQTFEYAGNRYMIMPYCTLDCSRCDMFNIENGCMPWAKACTFSNRKDGLDVYFQKEIINER
jgi:hypothetical protein